jgi:hypothetical protein
VKKTAKSQFFMLGTVPDGVKSNFLTASDVKRIKIREFMKASPSRASRVNCVTA